MLDRRLRLRLDRDIAHRADPGEQRAGPRVDRDRPVVVTAIGPEHAPARDRLGPRTRAGTRQMPSWSATSSSLPRHASPYGSLKPPA